MSSSAGHKKHAPVMSKIRSKDTKPELIVRKHLYHAGFRYRLNVRTLPGKPDIVLRKYRTIIFVNGCFWHGHEGCKLVRIPNRKYWVEKIRRNQERDKATHRLLRDQGWHVLVVWECQLKPSVQESTLLALDLALSRQVLDSYK